MPTAAYLVLTNVAPADWLGTIGERRQTIGRSEDADLRLPGEYVYVSRRHAEVWAEKDGHWIVDLESTSGTRVNSVPLAPNLPFRLMLGDRLWIGAAELDLVSKPVSVPRQSSRKSRESTVRYNIGTSAEPRRFYDSPDIFTTLTPAELDLVLWMSRGLTDPDDVARAQNRSPHTVRTHLRNIYSKLHVHSRDQVLACVARCVDGLTVTRQSLDSDR